MRDPRSFAKLLLASTALAGLSAAHAAAQSLPTGYSAAAGAVSFQKSSATLTINQTSQNAIVNYNSFSIGQQDTVNINQPGRSSVILNRVTGSTPSTIAGQLNANGQVYLINPNGVAITKTGIVKVGGGFVASSLAMSDYEWKHGRKHFKGDGSSAAVSNAGSITIGRGGYAALIGGEVTNSGLISAPLGKIGLGSGEAATLDVSGDGFLEVAVPTSVSGKAALIQDSGTISAAGGTVVLTAATARAAARNAVNISGDIDAHSISGHNGSILIGGGAGGSVKISGSLNVASRHGAGGSVTVTGDTIKLKHARILASGATGGGTVLIGGNLHGKGKLQQASAVTIDATSVIRADATASGDGGSVTVWSTGATTVKGLISAMGGSNGGNGGAIETSGATLDAAGATVTAAAPKGAPGAWLLDPTDLIIDQALATSVDATLNGDTSVTLATSAGGAPTVSNGATLTPAEQNTNGAGDIIVNSQMQWSSTAGLTLNAYNAITVNQPISFGGGGGLTLIANGSTNGGGIAVNANIANSGAGAVALTASALSFAQGSSLSFTGTNMTTGAPLGTLTINGAGYTLLNALAMSTSTGPDNGTNDIAGIDNNGAAGGDGGHYALAVNLVDNGTTFGAPLAGSGGNAFTGTFEGLGHTITNLTISDPNDLNVGLFGQVGQYAQNNGTVRDIGLVGGSVSGSNPYNLNAVGFLAGLNIGTITQAYATGAVNGGGAYAGGLVGFNNYVATITQSYATGAVSNAYYGGGLAGYNNGTIAQAYATGAVSGVFVGGLVGFNDGSATISQVYAAGAVSNNGVPGGLIGQNAGVMTQAYWDTLTSGLGNGIGSNYLAQFGSLTGYTTAQLQGASPISGSGPTAVYFSTAAALGSAFSGGANGVYPYLASFFPNGVQAVSGTVYSDVGATPAAGNIVSFIANNQSFGSVSTGANGYYYAFGPANSFASGASVLAYTSINNAATNAATLATATSAAVQPNVNIFGDAVTIATTATRLSTYLNGSTLAQARTAAQALAETADDAGHDASASIYGATGLGLIATGARFTIDAPVTATGTNFVVETTASGAPISVTAPITINDTVNSTGGLGLLAAGALSINANVTVTGAGLAVLAYDQNTPTPSVTDLAFAQGSSLSFTGVYNSSDDHNDPYYDGAPTGTLLINGAPYYLINSLGYNGADATLSAVAEIGLNGQGSAPFESGNYALATNLDGAGTTFGGPLAGSAGYAFTGTLEGLGHAITNLTISDSNDTNVGLIGQNNGTVRDLGLVGGSVASTYTGSGNLSVGALAGLNSGTIANVYATGAVSASASGGSGSAIAGDLVGNNSGTIINAYATGAVSGVGTVGDSTNVGGLVGYNDSSIAEVYATGAVSGSGGAIVGGLVGYNDTAGTISQAYATGAASGNGVGAQVGGLVGSNGGTVTTSYYDATTTGQAIGMQGDGSDGLTTGQLLGTVMFLGNGSITDASHLGPAFAGGANGVYPYLASFFPNGVQAVSGIAYTNAGATLLASPASGASGNGLPTTQDPGLVSVAVNGADLGTVTTGANGYYYLFVPAGTLPAGAGVIATTQADTGAYPSGAVNAASFASVASSGATPNMALAPNLNIYGGFATLQTPATSYAAAASSYPTTLSTAEGANTALSTLTSGLGAGYLATGASFTVDQPVTTSSGFLAATMASGAPLTVTSPITANSGGSLGLIAAGALGIDAPITVKGDAAVTLAYDQKPAMSPSPTDLSFGLTASGFAGSLTYSDVGGGSLAETTGAGGSLTINGTPYTLLYSLAGTGANGVVGIDANTAAGGDNGHYALATNLVDSGTTFAAPLAGVDNPITMVNNTFAGTLEGLGHTISDLTISSPNNYNIGLIGYSTGTLRDLGLVGGSVSGSYIVGSLVGHNEGTIVQAYATGAVSGESDVGGLIGDNDGGALVEQAYATGAVSGTAAVGGLIGDNNNGSEVEQAYATGAVSGESVVGGLIGLNNRGTVVAVYATGAVSASDSGAAGNAVAGGLVGQNVNGRISAAYATGAVSGAAQVGGLVGVNDGGLINNSYYDANTTGQTSDGAGASASTAAGSINGYDPNTGSIGLTTAQLQGLAPLSGGGAFNVATAFGAVPGVAGGANGLYPYLTNFFPNGVQAVSGTVYADAGVTPLASNINGAVTVSVIGNGAAFGSATTGANGYYYAFAPAGALTATQTLLAYTAADATANDAATLTTATGATVQTGVNLYGNAVTVPTAATSLLALGGFTAAQSAAQTLAEAADDANHDALASIDGASGLGLIASGAGFAVDAPATTASTFVVQTTAAAASLTVSQPMTITGTGSLGLAAAGALSIGADVTLTGAGSAVLAYDLNTTTPSVTDLAFAQGASLSFTSTSNGLPQGALTINGAGYTLLNSLAGAGANGVAGIDATGDGGNYALAVNLSGTGTAANAQFSAPLAGLGANAFSGTLEGLGHTITNLTINDPYDTYVGLIGQNNGAVRDIGLVGGSVSGENNVGFLAGLNNGAITQAYATGAVNGGGGVAGGLVGGNDATITQSYATGAVSNAYYGGGLVGYNGGAIAQSYATGAVSGSVVGGLVGFNEGGGAISQVYAAGAVSGQSTGGLIGQNDGYMTQAYWDTLTSGLGIGIGFNYTAQFGSLTGYTTAQLQGGVPISGSVAGGDAVYFSDATQLGNGAASAFAGGANGVYPYLASFFPNGVQAVSGTVFSDAGATRAAGNTVSVIANNQSFGSASTGANGYYYAFGPANSFARGASVLATTSVNTAATDAATLATATSAAVQQNVNLFGNAVTVQTPMTSLTAYFNANGGTLAAAQSAAQTAAETADDASHDALASINGATGLGLIASGVGFTVDAPVTATGTNFVVETTTSGAPLSVTAPITINDTVNTTAGLGLFAAGALSINANVTVTGAGLSALAYDQNTTTPSVTDLAFAQGASLSFAGVYNSSNDSNDPYLDGAPLGTLVINGAPYALLNALNLNGPSAVLSFVDGIDSYGSDSGNYALATNLDGTGTTFGAPLVGAGGHVFTGTFEGLGHTITSLTISDAADTNVGLIGQVGSGGVVRDIGLVGSSVAGDSAGSGDLSVGELVGANDGTIANVYATGAVSATASGSAGNAIAGGLVGVNNGGTIINAYVTDAVSATASGSAGNAVAGGLAGVNNSGTITNVYATGAVSATADNATVGGLAGANSGTIANAYATGAVSGFGVQIIGGLVGYADPGSSVLNSYYDTSATGQTGDGASATAAGSVDGYDPTTGSIGLTTAQLQGTALLSGGGLFNVATAFGSTAFAGGANGLYPYLTSFFPNGVQAITGTARTESGATLSGAQVTIYSGGALLSGGSVSSGANGYVYEAVPAGALAISGVKIGAAVTPSGATGATGLVYTDQGAVSSNVLVLGGITSGLNQQTTAQPTYSALQNDLSGAFGATTYSGLQTALAATPISITGTGASFALDRAMTSAALSVSANSIAIGADITTSGDQTYNGQITLGASTVTLDSSSGNGAILLDGPVIGGADSLVLKSGSGAQTLNGITSGGDLSLETTGVVTLDAGAYTTSGGQTYDGQITLGAPTVTLDSSSGNGAILLDGPVIGGGDSLVLKSGSGAQTLSGITTGGNLSLTTTGVVTLDAGAYTITGHAAPYVFPAVTTNGILTLGQPTDFGTVTLGGNTTINGSGVNAPINFNGAVDATTAGMQSLTVGSGSGTVTFSDAVGGVNALTNLSITSGALNLAAVNASGTVFAQTSTGNLTLNGDVESTASNDAVVLVTGGAFINHAGADALATANGRWLVYSQTPVYDTLDGLAYAFKQYNAPYDTTPTQATGDGILYALSPPIAPASELASTTDDVFVSAFGQPTDALPPIFLPNMGDASSAAQIVLSLDDPRFDEIVVCTGGAMTTSCGVVTSGAQKTGSPESH